VDLDLGVEHHSLREEDVKREEDSPEELQENLLPNQRERVVAREP